MSEVLILTNPGDPHAFAIQEALRQKGAAPLVWHTPDFPTLQKGSLWLEPNRLDWELSGPDLLLSGNAPRTVWVRRPGSPSLPDRLHDDDRAFAMRECAHFLRCFQKSIGSDAFWVNPPGSLGRASLKTEQLRAAVSAGLKIPRTLCSNDPDRIRQFLHSSTAGVVYKPFFPATWESDNGRSVFFTSELREEELLEEESVRACPGIFQEKVAKAWEIRLTVMGQHSFAVKLRSQEVERARVDWRAGLGTVPMEPVDLPHGIVAACRRLMADLGLVFGCFDLIVTPQGECVFLEVDEMGAFLWLEQEIPELRLLDAFCEFLLQGSEDFRWSATTASVRWSDVADTARHLLEVEAPSRHVIPQQS